MADRVLPGPVETDSCSCGSVNIHTSKIFDCCRDKDCVEDLRVYPTESSQTVINTAFSIRPGSAELLHVSVSVDDIGFNRGYYTVDVTYFYRVTGSVFPGGTEVTGLAVFDKRVILYGSEGSVKVFSSKETTDPVILANREMPTAYVEAVDPIALNMKLVEPDSSAIPDGETRSIPDSILAAFGEPLVLSGSVRRVYVTLGQFSIIRLERDTQLKAKDLEYFFPDKECAGSSEDDPCSLFSRVRFPVDEFFPPDALCAPESYKDLV